MSILGKLSGVGFSRRMKMRSVTALVSVHFASPLAASAVAPPLPPFFIPAHRSLRFNRA